MKPLPQSIVVIAVGLTAAAVGLHPVTANVARADAARPLAIVANPGLGVRDIAFSTLRRVFSGEATEVSGHRLIPLNPPAKDDTRRRFDLAVLQLQPDMIGPYWVDRRLRGQNGPPKTVPDSALLLTVVERLAGAISYVDVGMVTTKVEVLTVDGKPHTDRNYALR
jgi:ABC-type phosphate transport system substrate-binding protein